MIVDGKRALAHTERISWVEPIDGADNIEMVGVLGWNCIAKKGEFKPNDVCVYIEIDSKCPETNPAFEFLASKGYKVKTMKLGKFKFRDGPCISQGLALPLNAFIEHETVLWEALGYSSYSSLKGNLTDGVDVTDALKITYAVAEDNARKNGDSDAKYRSMAARHQNIFKKKWARWLMRRAWGKELMFMFFGKKKDKPRGFPTHFKFVHKSDEERCESIPWILENKEPWIKTQKIDGTSSTYILEKKGKKYEQYVCSRNVRQLTPSQKNYHTDIDGNVYWMMADKYHIFDFLKNYLDKNNLNYICLQGEIAGPSLQGNPHKFNELYFFGYNFIRSDIGRINSIDAKNICTETGIPWVPIADEHYILPDTMEELKLDADGLCIVGAGLREGWVYRSMDGQKSFKNVSRKYLLKHNE